MDKYFSRIKLAHQLNLHISRGNKTVFLDFRQTYWLQQFYQVVYVYGPCPLLSFEFWQTIMAHVVKSVPLVLPRPNQMQLWCAFVVSESREIASNQILRGPDRSEIIALPEGKSKTPRWGNPKSLQFLQATQFVAVWPLKVFFADTSRIKGLQPQLAHVASGTKNTP